LIEGGGGKGVVILHSIAHPEKKVAGEEGNKKGTRVFNARKKKASALFIHH